MKIERDGVALQSQLKRNNLDSLEQILHDSQKSTTKMREISRNSIFSDSMILCDDGGGVLFDANRILSIMPSDERDLYIFKKALKNEVDFIANSLQNLQNKNLQSANLAQDSALYDTDNISDYLTSNAMLFAKAHNTTGLISKIDALLM